MRRAMLAGVLVVLAAACSNGQKPGESATEVPLPDGMARCDEIFVAGGIVDPQTFGDACRSGDDEMVVPRPAVVRCGDGRELLWNDLAWGYVGEAMQLWEADQTDRVPVEEALECVEAPTEAAAAGSDAASSG